MAVAALIVAIVAALIALVSAAYARRQAVATEAAAAIKGKRMHDDLALAAATALGGTELRDWRDAVLTAPASPTSDSAPRRPKKHVKLP